jgi:hypothetical protein
MVALVALVLLEQQILQDMAAVAVLVLAAQME